MSLKKLDDLIETAWHAVNTDFDTKTIYQWKKQAFDYLAETPGTRPLLYTILQKLSSMNWNNKISLPAAAS